MLLIIDDDEREIFHFTRMFRGAGIECQGVTASDDAFHFLRIVQTDSILTDLAMSDMTGLELVEALGANKYRLGILSGIKIEIEHRKIFTDLGVTGFFDKNTEAEVLIKEIKDWLER